MKKVYEYSHLGGSEILKVRYPEIDAQIDEVIGSIVDVPKTKLSKEKTKADRMLYSPVWLNAAAAKRHGFGGGSVRNLRGR